MQNGPIMRGLIYLAIFNVFGDMGAGYLVPHLAAISDHIGHAGVHDDVTGHVQVRDALHKTNSLITANAKL